MSSYKNLIYFDIETCGCYENINEFQLNDPVGYSLFVKKHKKNKWEESLEDSYIKKASLLPEYGKIICISVGKFYESEFKTTSYIGTEIEILEKFNKMLLKLKSEDNLCGFNIKGYDIPWLNKKFYKYDIKIPKLISTLNKKPWEILSIDLFEIWKSTGFEVCSLDEVVYALGIGTYKSMNGENVHINYYDGKIDDISEYCKTDVKNCYLIADKLFKS